MDEACWKVRSFGVSIRRRPRFMETFYYDDLLVLGPRQNSAPSVKVSFPPLTLGDFSLRKRDCLCLWNIIKGMGDIMAEKEPKRPVFTDKISWLLVECKLHMAWNQYNNWFLQNFIHFEQYRRRFTPWTFNIAAPEIPPSQEENRLPTIIFKGQC